MIHTNSKVNVSVNDTTMGRVSGRRERMTGTTGVLVAFPEFRYKFKHWLDGQGSIVSTTPKLVITNWRSAEYQAVFEDVVMTYQDFVNHDAVETLVYFLETHGLSRPPEQGEYTYGKNYPTTHNITYHTAGNYPTGPATRTRRLGDTINTYPSTYGYSYWRDPANTSDTLISQGVYDASTDTSTPDSIWKRSPSTTSQLPASGFALSRLLNPGNLWYTKNPESLGRGSNPGDGSGTWGWASPFWGAYNNPTIGTPSHYPLLEYSGNKHFYLSTRSPDSPDMTGLEKLNAYGVYNWAEARCTSTIFCNSTDVGYWNIDAMAWWDNLVYAVNHPGHYNYSGWKKNNSGAQGLNNENVRYFEGFSYNHNLKHFAFAAGEYGPREKNPNFNSGWVAKYQNTPEAGSYLNMFRYTNMNRLRITYWGNPNSGRALDHYYKNLVNLSCYAAWSNYNGTRETTPKQNWQFKSCKNLTHIDLYHPASTSIFVLSGIEFISNLPKLRHLTLQPYGTTFSRYLTGIHSFPGKLVKVSLPNHNMQSYNPLPKELIHVTVDFNNPIFPNTDNSRHNHRMINFGGTITDT